MNAEPKTCPQCGAAIPAGAPGGMCPKCLLAGVAAPTEAGAAPDTKPRPVPPSIEEIADAFPQLEIVELIGQGGMGFVFRARQLRLERDVALKILPQHLANDPKFAERFAREGKLLAKLNHPNIVSIFDFGESGGFYFLLMEYVDGVNLRQAMRASRFTAEQALAIVPKICEALQFAHDEGVLHRDIKPENILLDAKGRIKIADFGIAKLTEEGKATFVSPGDDEGDESPATGMAPSQDSANLTVDGTSIGTPQYMAPEQINEPGSVDHRADIYSLGVVFYELLTGELPAGDFKPPSSKTPVDAEVDEVVARALAKERERRQQSAEEFKTQVETLGATREKNTPAPRWTNPVSIACIGLYVSLTLSTLVSALFGGSNSVYLVLMVLSFISAPIIWLVSAEKLGSVERSRDSERIRRSRSVLRVIAVVGLLFAIPSTVFGVFFVHSLMIEEGGWNPDLSEAVFVLAAWAGTILLPTASLKLLGETLSDFFKRRFPRPRVWIGAAMICLTLLIGAMSFVNRVRVMNSKTEARHQQIQTTQRAWHEAGRERFEAQVALDEWEAQTVNLGPEEMEDTMRENGDRLHAKLKEAQEAVDRLFAELQRIQTQQQLDRRVVGRSDRAALMVGASVIILGMILIVSGLWSRLPIAQTKGSNPWPQRAYVAIASVLLLTVMFVTLTLITNATRYKRFEADSITLAQQSDDPAIRPSLTSTNTLKAPHPDTGAIELYSGTKNIDEFVKLYTDASGRGNQAFLESMVLREALNESNQRAAIALLAPRRPQNIASTDVRSVEQRLQEKPDSFSHLPDDVVPRHIVYVTFEPEVGEKHSVEMATYFPVVEKNGALFIGAFYAKNAQGEPSGNAALEQSETGNPTFLTSSNTIRAPVGPGFIELLAVSHHPNNEQWWRPTGTRMTNEGFEITGKVWAAGTEKRPFEFVYRTGELPQDTSVTWKGTGGYGYGGLKTTDGEYLRNHGYALKHIDSNLSEADLMVGVSYENWERITSAENKQMWIGPNFHDRRLSIHFVEASYNTDGELTRTIVHDLDSSEWTTRVVIEEHDGKTHIKSTSGSGEQGVTISVRDVRLDNVKAWHLEARPIHWITFEGVKLPAVQETHSVSASEAVYNQIQNSWLKGQWQIVEINGPTNGVPTVQTTPKQPNRIDAGIKKLSSAPMHSSSGNVGQMMQDVTAASTDILAGGFEMMLNASTEINNSLAKAVLMQALKKSVVSFDESHMTTQSPSLSATTGAYESFRISPAGVIHLKFEQEDHEIRCTLVDDQLLWEPQNNEGYTLIMRRLPKGYAPRINPPTRNSANRSVAPNTSTNALIESQLEAARGITSFSKRDQALALVVQTAAESGNVVIARQVLSEMTSYVSRDNAASIAARLLHQQGKTEEAVSIANTMTSFTKRDAVLEELVK